MASIQSGNVPKFEPRWPEVESHVHEPGLLVGVLVGALFVLIGGGLMALPQGDIPQHAAGFWIKQALGAFSCGMGGLVFVSLSYRFLWPARIRHADAKLFPTVPREPVIESKEAMRTSGGHELVATEEGWQLRSRLGTPRYLTPLAIFIVVTSALPGGGLAVAFHGNFNNANWPVAILLAVVVTGFYAAFFFSLFAWMWHMESLSQPVLTIPTGGGDLQLELPAESLGSFHPTRRRLSLARADLIAVQLCPYHVEAGEDSSWGVQGLLVMTAESPEKYRRVPVLHSPDRIRGARIMRDLAAILQAPYLFHGDVDGWHNMRAARP